MITLMNDILSKKSGSTDFDDIKIKNMIIEFDV